MAIYESDPKTGAIQPLQGDVSQESIKEALRVMDSMDDQQIIQEMTTGVGTDVLFYKFAIKSGDGARDVVGISVEGGYELANRVRNLQAQNNFKVDKDSDPDYVYVIVPVLNLATNNIFLGVGRQCKFIVGRGNEPIRNRPDEHWFVKGFSKAQRNGILHHADQIMMAQLIETWAKGGKGRLLQAPPVSTGEAPKAAAQARTVIPAQPAAAKPAQAPAPAATPAPASVTPSAAPAPAATTVVGQAEQILASQAEEVTKEINKLRVQVHNKFQNDLGINAEKRKEHIRAKFKDIVPVPDSLTQLSLNQLKEMLAYAEDMINKKAGGAENAPPATVPAPEKTALGFDSVAEQEKMAGEFYDKLTNPTALGLDKAGAIEFITKRGYTKSRDIPKDKLSAMLTEVQALIDTKGKPADF